MGHESRFNESVLLFGKIGFAYLVLPDPVLSQKNI